jgi:hypothetical protein
LKEMHLQVFVVPNDSQFIGVVKASAKQGYQLISSCGVCAVLWRIS